MVGKEAGWFRRRLDGVVAVWLQPRSGEDAQYAGGSLLLIKISQRSLHAADNRYNLSCQLSPHQKCTL